MKPHGRKWRSQIATLNRVGLGWYPFVYSYRKRMKA